MGRTKNVKEGNAFQLTQRSGKQCDVFDGYLNSDGRIMGTYIHGLFANRKLRRTILANIAKSKGTGLSFDSESDYRQDEYDKLADLVRNSLDIDLIYSIAGLEKKLPEW